MSEKKDVQKCPKLLLSENGGTIIGANFDHYSMSLEIQVYVKAVSRQVCGFIRFRFR